MTDDHKHYDGLGLHMEIALESMFKESRQLWHDSRIGTVQKQITRVGENVYSISAKAATGQYEILYEIQDKGIYCMATNDVHFGERKFETGLLELPRHVEPNNVLKRGGASDGTLEIVSIQEQQEGLICVTRCFYKVYQEEVYVLSWWQEGLGLTKQEHVMPGMSFLLELERVL
jgi:hypothetical protein